MSLTHFDPLANIRLFEDAFTRMFNEPQTNRPWSPAVDIYETENELVLKADLPDVDLKDIDVRVENQTLTIAGERKFEQQDSRQGLSPHRAQLRQLRAQLRRAQHLRYRQDRRRVQERRADRHAAQEGSRQAAPDQSRSHGVSSLASGRRHGESGRTKTGTGGQTAALWRRPAPFAFRFKNWGHHHVSVRQADSKSAGGLTAGQGDRRKAARAR